MNLSTLISRSSVFSTMFISLSLLCLALGYLIEPADMVKYIHKRQKLYAINLCS
jgi:hypothetical protein